MDFQYELIQPSKVASSSNHDNTKAENVLDGNNDSKWSAKGKDQYLEIDLGETKAVSGLAIKFYEADIRRMQYTIYSSDKGGKEEGNWRRIGSAVSSGSDANEYEENAFERPINARFFKVVGEGNDLNSFISIVDLKVFGARKPQDKQELIAGEIKTEELLKAKAAEAKATPVTKAEGADVDEDAPQVAGDTTKGAQVKANTKVVK